MNTAELDVELLRTLKAFGLNEHNYKAICLLPLVQVAWADGKIQDAERAFIKDIAEGHELLGRGGQKVVDQWLASEPDEAFYRDGRELLVKLAFRKRGLGAEIPKRAVDSVVDFCSLVAESAGGLFDLYWTVSAGEKKAIRLIAEHLGELSKQADPHLGIVGHSLAPEWEQVHQSLSGIDED